MAVSLYLVGRGRGWGYHDFCRPHENYQQTSKNKFLQSENEELRSKLTSKITKERISALPSEPWSIWHWPDSSGHDGKRVSVYMAPAIVVGRKALFSLIDFTCDYYTIELNIWAELN